MSKKSRNNKAGNTRSSPRQREMLSSSDYTRLKEEESSDNEPPRTLKVYIYESEFVKIKNWVLLYKNIETGGDLFGLWIDSHTAVVQFALGPGKNCTRYKTAFYQDLEYLAQAGSHFTKKHGLCNIGQWHSHHQLSLAEPSSGDENTVWNHMPILAMERYIVCIANIFKQFKRPYSAKVNCFLFEINQGDKLPVLKGQFKILKQSSPMNEHSEIVQVVGNGAEEVIESDEDSSQREFSMSRLWNKLKKCLCPTSWKYLALITVFASPFIVVAIWYIATKDVPQY